jgi:hypothetical protein
MNSASPWFPPVYSPAFLGTRHHRLPGRFPTDNAAALGPYRYGSDSGGDHLFAIWSPLPAELRVSNTSRLARYTLLFAGTLIAIYITLEATISGMSMNPARSLGSALAAQRWTSV